MILKDIPLSGKFKYAGKVWTKHWVSQDGLEIKCINQDAISSILPPDLIVEQYEIN